jgi:hypothetical protein
MKELLTGIVLMCAILPMAILGLVFITVVGLFGNTSRARHGVRALDHFLNASLFNGYAWESLSSHSWREREKRWAKIIINITNKFHKDHCKKANKREQHIVDLMLKKKLHEQTVGRKVEQKV